MNRRLQETVSKTTETRAVFVLLVVLVLRAWRTIPSLRPIDLVFPATLAQILIFIVASLWPQQFIFILAIGNFIIVLFAMFPVMFQQRQTALR
jgi:hypothetical protein